jgi:RNA polymerase sigma-70 factor (ECF subfamily)
MRDVLADRRVIGRVYAYVAYRVGDGAEAEDITGDVFERALRYADSFDRRRGDPVAWLIGIARRCIADSVGGRVEWTDEIPEQAVDDQSELAVDRADLRAAVAALGERDRELVALRYGADLTARQIAALLELKTNAVEVALHRALNTMRAHLDRDPDAPPSSGLRWAAESRP